LNIRTLVETEPSTASRWKKLTYRILFFESNVLVAWEELDVADHLSAIEIASSRYPERTVELWSERRKVAVFRPAATRHHG